MPLTTVPFHRYPGITVADTLRWIFDNISVLDYNKKNLGVSRQMGKYQDPLNIVYNVQTGKFEVDQNDQ